MVLHNQNQIDERRRAIAEERFGGVCECGMHAWARLTKGYVVLVDVGDAALIQTQPYTAKVHRDAVYAKRRNEANSTTYLHRELAKTIETGFNNGNPLDLRRSNLLSCTRNDSMHRRRSKKNSASRFKGVHIHKFHTGGIEYCYWVVQVAGRYRGSFPLTDEGEIAAALAHDRAARETFGVSAALNFPTEGERSALRSEQK